MIRTHAQLPALDAIVIGGGFYGCMLAIHLGAGGGNVVLIEKQSDILSRASCVNQARVHNGYHYPRSLLTALRSRVNLPRFLAEFDECVDRSFEKVYAIAARQSHVTSRHFVNFCRRIDAPVKPARPAICDLFDRHQVESVFTVEEYAFDVTRLRGMMWSRLRSAGVDVRLDAEVQRVREHRAGGLLVEWTDPEGGGALITERTFNCTYSQINPVLARSGLPTIPLKHEVTELALVRVPEELASIGVTVMCGPFFSCMPFPSRGIHSLSHVRYTPHTSWQDNGHGALDPDVLLSAARVRSRFSLMLRDALRYMPALAGCRHIESLFEVKTVLPATEHNDGRPILLQEHAGLPGLTCVLASKIDNVFDMLDAVPASVCTSRRRAE